ncbi:hypothetical protein [Clostridium botulinum]|uniref:hypothetical protein n=1 Tax=Clostridium botulinum TaxID=1491 RepID=UPI001C9A76B4|nr:hypothetical protein [Clostridium botulinum]MBY6876252.1 hypothetical protein [Clostridium botulinum]
MDYKLLDEHLEFIQPYLIKWFREYNILMLEADYKIYKYEVLDGFINNPRTLICQGYINSIKNAFKEMIKSYYYSVSANLIEKELLKEGQEWSGCWKYEIKNYYCRNLIPQFFSILDYIAVMINELSKQQLITKIYLVNFKKIKHELSKYIKNDYVGWLTNNDIRKINTLIQCAYLNITDEEKEVLKPYRNKAIHRYLIGIDEILVNTHRKELTNKDKKMFQVNQGHKYSVKFKPEYNFNQLIIIIEKLINNLDLMISELMRLDIMKEVIKVKEPTS